MPLGQGSRAAKLAGLTIHEMAFLIEVVVDRAVNGGELLQRLHLPEALHCSLSSANPLADIGGEQRSEPVPPEANGFVTDVDAALEQQILDVPQRQREADIHHHHEADDLG